MSVSSPNYRTTTVNGVQVFAGETALLPVDLLPISLLTQFSCDNSPVVIDIPPNGIDAGSSSDKPDEGISNNILDRVVIPEYIVVHLGRPAAIAQNVSVRFSDYIKNVCCSEIYPTWPESAIRANMYCQISLALNRIFTEWYRSIGLAFDITNSTSFDQYFVYGRNIYDNISRIADEIFDDFIKKGPVLEPYYAEYCNGTTATCPGLKQWGTVPLAQQGFTPLAILRYYFGNTVNLFTAPIVGGTLSSYPGTPLRLGSSGSNVGIIQTQLTRIRKNYPLIPVIGTVDGIFGATTEAAVKQFQKIFLLTTDGVVGKATWYKLSYIFVAVKKLAELTSEGITNPNLPPTPPGNVLRPGSTGDNVRLAQFLLNIAANFVSDVPETAVDGIFGNSTSQSVRDFQKFSGLVSDGIIGPATWSALYDIYYSVLNSVTAPNITYPGTALRVGSRGSDVGIMQRYINFIGSYYTKIPKLAIDMIFGAATANSVKIFQSLFGLSQDGVIGPDTWSRIVSVYDTLVSYVQ
ncbi:MAG: peptidoglycan-binding protein [Oscillospiraceae bacterium]